MLAEASQILRNQSNPLDLGLRELLQDKYKFREKIAYGRLFKQHTLY